MFQLFWFILLDQISVNLCQNILWMCRETLGHCGVSPSVSFSFASVPRIVSVTSDVTMPLPIRYDKTLQYIFTQNLLYRDVYDIGYLERVRTVLPKFSIQ